MSVRPAGPVARPAPRADRPAPVLFGIDFGGTKMAVGVADGEGRLLARERVPTHAEQGAPQALDRALDLAGRLLADVGAPLAAAGVGRAGRAAARIPPRRRSRSGRRARHRGRGGGHGTRSGAGRAPRRGRRDRVRRHRRPWPGTMLELGFSGRALDRLAESSGVPGGVAGLAAAAERPGPARDALTARVDELARHPVTCCLLLDPQRVGPGGIGRRRTRAVRAAARRGRDGERGQQDRPGTSKHLSTFPVVDSLPARVHTGRPMDRSGRRAGLSGVRGARRSATPRPVPRTGTGAAG
ncbi:hypothetical protein GCM10010429_52920 [Micromonospora olivasterospora]|uniref:ROK family protein n=1 Tax=Micromonospora olivasterospora TaxID=1880 RepID=A0A562I5A0_MICOL|nr:hypothetical protein JD77_00825 [Micromonospora olivasterospora]